MKKLFAVLLAWCAWLPMSQAHASAFSSKLGLNADSFGGIFVHDFQKSATLTGLQWDASHIFYKEKEVAEVGFFGGKRDVDAHLIVGPSFGTPGGSLGSIFNNAKQYVDWPFLDTLQDMGQYVHAYFNIGWDLSKPKSMKATPDLIGLGGVLKFGK